MIDTTLAHYRVVAKLGEGGMGEVWRAEDTKLGRRVALKMLPAAFAEDPDRLARFEREARVLASLNHPNIAGIYGLEQDGDQRFLVMELAEGRTLEQRLADGALPLEDAVEIAIEIAEALEAAHERGIVHRDLKPANVVIDSRDQVKVLDFGLAKAVEGTNAEERADTDLSATELDQSPTLAMTESLLSPASGPAVTAVGMLLGTASYMSPEQARAKSVDRRADIWAFGCVFYEMLVGRKAFAGATLADVLGAITHREPDLDSLPPTTPFPIRRLLNLCFRKDPSRRLQSIGDARIALQDWQDDPQPSASVTDPTRRGPMGRRSWLPWAVSGALAVLIFAVLGMSSLRDEAREEPVRRFTEIIEYPTQFFPNVELSSDGAWLAVVFSSDGRSELVVRALNESRRRVVRDGSFLDAPYRPFFSPEADEIAFFSGNGVYRMPVRGGTPTAILQQNVFALGGHWGKSGRIVFAPDIGGRLATLNVADGTDETILSAPEGASRPWFSNPRWLPGEQSVVFSYRTGRDDDAWQIGATRLDEPEIVPITRGRRGLYLGTGHLAFLLEGQLHVVPFDPDAVTTTGPAVPMLLDLAADGVTVDEFSVADDGLLAYTTNTPRNAETQLQWIENGAATPLWTKEDNYGSPRLSPDGKSLLITKGGGTEWDLWRLDLENETESRLTFAEGEEYDGIWSPDGEKIAFLSSNFSDGSPMLSLYWMRSDGSGSPERLLDSDDLLFPMPTDWDPDGSRILVESGGDLYFLDLDADRRVSPFAASEDVSELEGAFSPNGRFIAYISDETGPPGIFIRTVDGPGKWQVESEWSGQPVWSPDGSSLYYRMRDGLFAVSIETSGPAPRWGPRRRISDAFTPGETRVVADGAAFRDFDVGAGGRILAVTPTAEPATARRLHFVSGFFQEVRAASP